MRVWKQHKLDANQAEVVGHLRAMGCSVQSLAEIGNGCPDLLVGVRGRTFLIELKDGRRPPSERGLTPDQVKWHNTWAGARVIVAYSAADAWNAILGELARG